MGTSPINVHGRVYGSWICGCSYCMCIRRRADGVLMDGRSWSSRASWASTRPAWPRSFKWCCATTQPTWSPKWLWLASSTLTASTITRGAQNVFITGGNALIPNFKVCGTGSKTLLCRAGAGCERADADAAVPVENRSARVSRCRRPHRCLGAANMPHSHASAIIAADWREPVCRDGCVCVGLRDACRVRRARQRVLQGPPPLQHLRQAGLMAGMFVRIQRNI